MEYCTEGLRQQTHLRTVYKQLCLLLREGMCYFNVMTVKRLHTWEYERFWKRFDRNITGLVYNRMSANTLPVVIFATKPPLKTKRSPMNLVQSIFPMERIATDILGELPETEDGNRYSLVVSDRLLGAAAEAKFDRDPKIYSLAVTLKIADVSRKEVKS